MDENMRNAVARWKERKPEPGIYAIRCPASNELWVGAAPDLGHIQNRIWFTLRHGSCRHRSLQAAWAAHGADGLRFEIVERLVDEPLDYVRDRQLRDGLHRWATKLGATRL